MNSKNHPPRFFSWILRKLSSQYSMNPALGDLEEIYADVLLKHGKKTAARWYRKQVLKSIPSLIRTSLSWNIPLLISNIKTAFRVLLKQKGMTFINIAGLATGLACCLLITRFVLHEQSYDTHHNDLDRIFHIKMKVGYAGSNQTIDSWDSSYRVVEVLKEDYPDVQSGTIYKHISDSIVKYGDKKYSENRIIYAYQDIFDILTIPVLHGDISEALTRPFTIVLTRSFAEKYFGVNSPVGKSLSVENEDFEITAVVEDPPGNSYFKYTAIIDAKSRMDKMHWLNPVTNWTWFGFYSYIKLAPGVDPVEFGNKIRHLAHNYADANLKERGYANHTLTLQPVTELHLNSRRNYRTYLKMFMIVGIAIVLIACVNYINLITAGAANRARNIGIRKVNGANRGQLVSQFFSESLVQTGMAFIFAIGICILALPPFNTLAGTQFTITHFLKSDIILFGILLLFSSILLAGIYPALYLSQIKPATVLRGKFETGSGRSRLRRGLVLFQFIVSILLICSTGTIYRQIQHMKNANLGFSKEQKLVIPIKDGKKYLNYKQEFQKIPGVSLISFSHKVPGRVTWINSSRLLTQPEEDKVVFNQMFFDENSIQNFGIKLAAGNTFDLDLYSDNTIKCLINLEGMKSLGINHPQDAIGKMMTGWSGEYEIIGVTEDFHFQGLQNKINPLQILHIPRLFGLLTLTVSTENLSRTLEAVEQKWTEIFPNDIFGFRFLDDDINRLYRSEERLGRIFGLFSLLAIFISCLGLVGLSAYMAEKRKKEIGIRKVLGAGTKNIVGLLSREFLILISISNLVAIPAAWYLLNSWLQNFAYRIDTEVSIFILTAVISFTIALLTVSFRSVKAALSNPVDTIRSD